MNFPEKYNITITIEPEDQSTEFTLKMAGIPRADILAADYKAQGIASAVRTYESMMDYEPEGGEVVA